MSFMQPQIVFDDWWKVEGQDGTTFLPYDLVGPDPTPFSFAQYLESGKPAITFEIVKGYGARMSAPGYMDCTPWTVFETEDQAKEYLKETYDVED
jgi:hypothetical protein